MHESGKVFKGAVHVVLAGKGGLYARFLATKIDHFNKIAKSNGNFKIPLNW